MLYPNSRKKKFNEYSNNEYAKKIRFYPTFLYFLLDKWLKKMSAQGWHIVHCGIFTFWFEKGKPSEKEYFTYGLSTQEGKYSVSLRYPYLKKTYGVDKKKSVINANENKAHQIVEIDIQRIDVEKDIGYKELIRDRNRLYMAYFLRNLLLCLSVFAIFLILFCF